MDSLLASYASDDDDDQEKEEEEEEHEEKPQPTLIAAKPSLFGRLPPPKNSASGSLFAPQSQSLVKSEEGTDEAVPKRRPGLFAKLPPPKVERFGADPDDEGLGFGSKPSSLFAALPPPKVTEVEFDSARVKVETGSGNPNVKKQVVAFKPPIDVSVLEDDDDGWRPAQKRVKAEAGAVVKGGGGLQALLPAPKNSLGLGSALGGGGGGGGRRAAMEVAARTEDVNAEPAAVNSRMSVPSEVKKEGFGSQGRVQYDNSAYAVDESAAFAPQVPYSNEAYGCTAPQGAYAPAEEIPQSIHNVDSRYEQQNWQYAGNTYYSSQSSQASQASYAPANSAPVSDPVAQVLQAERRRGREDKMAAPTVIEVKQADLTGGKVREDQLRTTGIAFGPTYQPVSSSKDKPSKIQRRKHQIGTLLHDMKAREMELLDRRAKGSLTKAETQAKYGW